MAKKRKCVICGGTDFKKDKWVFLKLRKSWVCQDCQTVYRSGAYRMLEKE